MQIVILVAAVCVLLTFIVLLAYLRLLSLLFFNSSVVLQDRSPARQWLGL